MTKIEHLLTCLAEECMETAQRASKAIRFGINEIQSGQPLDNSDRIVLELNDILAVAELLAEENAITSEFRIQKFIDGKKEKLRSWMAYSEKMGSLAEHGLLVAQVERMKSLCESVDQLERSINSDADFDERVAFSENFKARLREYRAAIVATHPNSKGEG